MSDDEITLIGANPEVSILWMQVKSGKPQMKCIDGLLRPFEFPEKGIKVLLGDISSIILKISGPHDSVRFSTPPTFDEQKWDLEINCPELRIKIESYPYWGFGLFSSCYLNKVELRGSLLKRSKLIYDLVAVLGRNPWEPKINFFWERATKHNIQSHHEKWLELLNYATKAMEEEIQEILSRNLEVKKRASEPKLFPPNWNKELSKSNLEEVEKNINIAKQALHDQNAAALKRALDRAEAKLIEADPLVGMQNEELIGKDNSKVLIIDEIPFVDLVNEEE